VGAVASSAPVQAKVDFYEYMLVVENSTRAFGSDGCADNVQSFFTWLQNMTTTIAGRRALAQEHGFCDTWDGDWVSEKDVEMLSSDYEGYIGTTVQYDDEWHMGLGQVCGSYSNSLATADANAAGFATMRKIAQLRAETSPDSSTGSASGAATPCNNWSYASYVDYMKQIGPGDAWDAADRCWIWQTCNEFGFYQSTDRGYNIFGSSLPVNFFIDLCADVFGPQFTRETIDANVRRTNACYGGALGYNGTNVVFVNGSEDPWHPLGVYYPINVNVTSILIDGTSHCADMITSDMDAVIAVQEQINAVLGSWLGN